MICIIQARMSSLRLPNKVLIKIYNKTMLERVINSIKKSKKITKIIVATSILKSDDKIQNFCKAKNIECYRGSINNVYSRFAKIIINLNCKDFIRISGDSPLIDYRLIDKAINIFNKKKSDIVTNVFPRSFPQGQSVEIINSKIFIKNFKNIKKKTHKEHITKYFYENFKNFKITNFSFHKNYNHLNISINNQADLKLVKKIIKKTKNKNLNLMELLLTSKELVNEKK
jgi:spore coat polysaccharide biosynthesis protein SpsF